MYESIEAILEKKAPLADINAPTPNSEDQEDYFQLLADYGITLNAAQHLAVTTVEGPLQVVAGAGSGKTTVLTTRVAYMVSEKDIDPESILLVTFTKKASQEMIQRLKNIPGMSRYNAASVHAGTFHAICLKMLRDEGYQFNLLSSERKRLLVIKSILKGMGLNEAYSPEAVLMYISNWKNSLITPDLVMPANEVEFELQNIYKQYENYKADEELFDFDDILLEAYYLLKFESKVLSKYQERYQYILCDEFQDTSAVQYEIILMLAKPHNNLCIVGDDDQTIYGFRCAKSTFMVNFHLMFPDCRQIIMDINYRSTANVIGISNSIIKNNTVRIEKQLKSVSEESIKIMYNQPKNSDEEAKAVISDIIRKAAAGTPLSEMAVIYRTHATGRAIFDKLLEAGLPFITYSQKSISFYENTFVKPILSVLRAISTEGTPEDMVEAAPIFYVSKSDMQNAVDSLFDVNNHLSSTSFKDALYYVASKKSGYQQKSLMRKADALSNLKSMKPAAAIHHIRKGDIDYEHQLEVDGRKTLSLHKEMILESLDEIEQSARSSNSIDDFLLLVKRVIEKNKEMEELRKLPNIDAIKLMTIHTSKGLEFDVVYAIGWSDGILPHASALRKNTKPEDTQLNDEQLIEEERRLGYVAVTRAKRFLHLSSPQQHRGKKAEISRFLQEAMQIKDW